MTGLNGSFSSNTVEIGSANGLASTNQYGLEISTGWFFRERWFIGANVNAQRGSGGGFIERDYETFLIASLVNSTASTKILRAMVNSTSATG